MLPTEVFDAPFPRIESCLLVVLLYHLMQLFQHDRAGEQWSGIPHEGDVHRELRKRFRRSQWELTFDEWYRDVSVPAGG